MASPVVVGVGPATGALGGSPLAGACVPPVLLALAGGGIPLPLKARYAKKAPHGSASVRQRRGSRPADAWRATGADDDSIISLPGSFPVAVAAWQ